ncbi:X-X-X-Leu-X-X-Gly heptad repeat-containing protein [Pseudomonas cuatrocienegasensis]|uniref:X-X-X-Leu-X-X-Gly heptad repeat-containing protein n=2 Tax=Pseudomonas cuatrocienegasensis TaxID=543360 RepID=A0ABY1B4P1_9PSED|nr:MULTISPECIES: methyl-accepting chemotaxis protein [Pseudomonas]OEC37273.1 chemotaxis protein [Pseudomonas sp. 21C1]SEP91338.1 X-X-X-Leu-X-X-Gly heptad repeat-containing protein [Pseudomonas cuatrocienegasensis]
MGRWIRNLSLKYKFWGVNLVALVTTLLLVLFAMHLEQQSRAQSAREQAKILIDVLADWPAAEPLPAASRPMLAAAEAALLELPTEARSARGWIALNSDPLWGENPLYGVWRSPATEGRELAIAVTAPSLWQVFRERAGTYALAVSLLMLLLMAASQLLIRFILSHLNNLKDSMLHAAHSGDLSARASCDSDDEVGQMAGAFNAMQAGYQRVVGTVAEAAARLDEGAQRLASGMAQVRSGMLGQQSETDQTATAINEMSATVFHIAEHAAATRDQSTEADRLSGDGRQAVERTGEAIAGLSRDVQQAAERIQRLAEDSQTIASMVSVIHGIAEQTNLLALNAAIEAARAGDMGRGFAVVADEVRNLARRVQTSTDSITQMITTLQGSSREAVQFMQDSSARADQCVQQAEHAATALGHIAQAVAQMRQSNIQIAVAAEQQSQVAEEMTRSVVGIRDVTEQTVQQTLISAGTSAELVELAANLNQAVGRLKL